MPHSLVALMRRTRLLLDPLGHAKALREVQEAVAITMVTAAYAPLNVFNAKLASQRKARKRAVGRTLGVAMNQVRAGQALMPVTLVSKGRSHAVPTIPEGAQYLARRCRCVAGARRYKLYLPASQPKKPQGLIVMLHGCHQSPDDFAVGTHMNQLAEKHGLAIAYPQQTRRNNAALCWNWFRPEDQTRGSGEPAILAALTRKLVRELRIRRDRTFVVGLSAGGAMAAIMIDQYPDLFAGAGIHSGLARGAAEDVISAMSSMRGGGSGDDTTATLQISAPVRRIVFQGDNDSTVHPSNAANIVTAVLGEGATPLRVVNGSVRGRGYTRSTYAHSAGVGTLELWIVAGAGHAWSGGKKAGSYTDTTGPDASAQMVRFFLAKPA